MRNSRALLCVSLSLGACASTGHTVAATTPLPIEAAFECATNELKARKYRILRTDPEDGVLEAQRAEKGSAADLQELARGDHILVEGKSSQSNTDLKVTARFFRDLRLYRGPTVKFEPARAEGREDAEAIAAACGSADEG